jgi:hypothetical protein
LPTKNKIFAVLILGTLVLSLVSIFSLAGLVSTVGASPNNTAKPMHFYFHYLATPVYVAGTDNHYVMNTTKLFQAYNNSVYKPAGQPKIIVNYYLYPNLAGSVTINGTWQVFLWANGSALKPCGWILRFYEREPGGGIVWQREITTAIITGGPTGANGYLDVPVYCYNLSTPLPIDHTFGAGNSVEVEVEINPSGAIACQVWYDSVSFPSKAILPCQDYARPVSIKTYDVNYAETHIFQHNWTQSRRKVIVHANVTDPFGGYDIYKVNVTIFDPSGQLVLDNVDMTRVSDGLWLIQYLHTYEANWTYPETAVLGNYTVEVSVIDNNGYYHFLEYGTFNPYIERASHVFNIGIVILYDPSFKVVDDVDNPLPRAQAYIRLPNGTINTLPLYTDDSGVINLQQVPSGNYTFTVLWKDVVVQQTTQYVDSDGPYTIECRVYQLTANVLGNNGAPVHGAYVVIYTHAGIVYDFKMTDSAGHAVFQLPSSDIQVIGSYTIEVHYSTTYWLTAATSTATKPLVSVTSSGPVTITLTNFPPSIWTTTGFLLLIALVVGVVLGTIALLYKKGIFFKRKTSKTK